MNDVNHRMSRVLPFCLALLLTACGGGEDRATGTTADPVGGGRARAMAAAQPMQSSWSALKGLPLVPVSMANLPDGKVLMWSAGDRFSYGAPVGQTYSLTYDPITDAVTERTVTETGHEMFCPGTAILADGRLLVNGGVSSLNTSIFNPATGAWSIESAMNIPRGYNADTLLKDGSVLTLGGSWSGGAGNKHAEVWTQAAGWKRLSGVPIDSILYADPAGVFRGDNHLALLPAGNGRVFHAGPSANMHWINTTGNGAVANAGPRSDDENSICGTYVMFDTGKILKVGGSSAYQDVNANRNAFLIDINTGVSVRKLGSMAYQRAFQNGVVLPNGQVVILGGQTYPVPFTDGNSVLVPELWDPTTETFTPLPAMATPRNYHSVGMLLPDARVISAGGGLCGVGCSGNHADMQILSPNYLFNADGTAATRPIINSAPTSVGYGQIATVTTDSAIASFAMVRMSSTTHTVNNDQRRLSLSFNATGVNTYAVDIPSNPGWALPGYWMLFAMNANGTPSVARVVRIALEGAPQFAAIEDQTSTTGAPVSLQPIVTVPDGATATYAASGLPVGLAIDAATSRIQGVPNATGTSRVTVRATTGSVTTSTDFTWSVVPPGVTRYVKLEALSEVNGNAWSSAAEINLLGLDGQTLPHTGWQVSADSQELAGQDGGVANAIDGNSATIWHTQWQAASPVPPHWIVIDLGATTNVTGLRYLPRQDGISNGTIARYNVYLSADGVSWGAPVTSGNFSDFGVDATEKSIYFNNLASSKAASQSSDPNGAVASRAVDGNIDGNFADASVTLTGSDTNAWWEVDLGASYALSAVRLWNRTDCCANLLSNFDLLASDTPMQGRTLTQLLADPTVWHSLYAGSAPRATLIDTAGIHGRYVRVQLVGTNYLSLAEVEVYGRLSANRAPAITTPPDTSSELGQSVSLTVSASDPDGDPLTYSASGLPPGLAISTSTGVISGTSTTEGSYAVTVVAADGRGGSTATQFNWTVVSAAPQLEPVLAAPVTSGAMANYTVGTTNAGSFSYTWTFGDGSPATAWSNEPTASHTYGTPGLYLVTVSAQAADGSAASRSFWQAVQGGTGQAGSASSQVLLEPRTAGASRLWVVNPDNDSVSVFDTKMRLRLAEIPVGSAPRTLALAPDGRIWVANQRSDTISIISPNTLSVEQTVTLPRASQPYGVVIAADGGAYVTLAASGAVAKVDATGELVTSAFLGAGLRHLSLSSNDEQLLVSRYISRPLPGEGTANVQTNALGTPRGGEVFALDTSLALQRIFYLRVSTKTDNSVQARGVPNYLGAPVVAPDGRSAWVPSTQDNIQRGKLRDGLDLDFQSTVRAISSRIDLIALDEDVAARIDHDNSGVASAAAYHPTGAYLFVALEASRHVAVVDPVGKRELLRVDTGRAPQGLVVSDDGLTLYVHNFMDRTVGVYDLTRLVRYGELALPLTTTMSTVGTDKLSALVLKGKQFFYDARDPRIARDSYISCASCHNDGGGDGRTWDFTGFGEGLRNTINLRGRAGGQGRLHWSANFDEVQDFEGQLRTLGQGTGLMSDAQFNSGTHSQPLGDKKAGVSADLDALAAYVGSLSSFDNTPYRDANGALTFSAIFGRKVFQNQCASCHSGNDFTDSTTGLLHNIGTLKPSSGNRLGATLTGIDTPTLRDVWASPPYLHDGSAATLKDAVLAHTGIVLNSADLSNVIAFVRQIGREEPGFASTTARRYVKLEALSEINGNPWSSAAEINLLSPSGQTLARTGWRVSADSQELTGENGAVANAIDGNNATIWHTQWQAASPAPPHWIVIDLGVATDVAGLRYLPRQSGGANGTIARYNIYLSVDGVNWGTPVKSGNFSDLSPGTTEKVLMFGSAP